MKRFTKLTALLAVAAAAPAIVAPTLIAPAQAQETAKEFQDVPVGHWAYPALQKLAAAGILEGYPPTGNFIGQRPMTRYEFAVAIARLLDRIPNGGTVYNDTELRNRITALEARPIPDVTRAQVQDLIDALRREFQDEIARINGRLGVIEDRLTTVENRVPVAPRTVLSASLLHHRGFGNYIQNGSNTTPTGVGRQFLRRDLGGVNSVGAVPNYPVSFDDDFDDRVANRTFSYTDLEVRLTDRVSDRLSVNAALRSLGSNFEDPWAGDSGGGLYIREAFVSANLSNTRTLGLRGLQATLGRQRTKYGVGLLYDNDLSPTDQLRYDANLGPIALSGFFGTQNNVSIGSGFGSNGTRPDPYGTQGSVYYLATADGAFVNNVGFANSIGFPAYADDNESLIRAGVNLFRIAGQPVQLAYTRLFDGFRAEHGDSVDISVPLFNRTIGLEVVRNLRQANGQTYGDDRPTAGIVTLDVLRTKVIDLNLAYGRASGNFQYLAASSANPYARSYGQALFDRPIFLGAPMINETSLAGEPQFLAAKSGFDINGTLRLPISFLRRVPLDFRYYQAESGNIAGPGGVGKRDLGEVYTLGTNFALTPGVNLEVKGGIYNPANAISETIRYVRIGASVGF